MIRLGASLELVRDTTNQPHRLPRGLVLSLERCWPEDAVTGYQETGSREPWDEAPTTTTVLRLELVSGRTLLEGYLRHPNHLLRTCVALHTPGGVVWLRVLSPFFLKEPTFPASAEALAKEVPETYHMTLLRGHGWEAHRRGGLWIRS